MHPNSSKAILYAPRCLASIGAGLSFPMSLFAVQTRQKGDDIGTATSVQIFARSLGTTFGVGLGGVIFQNKWTTVVGRHVISNDIPQSFIIPSNVAEVAYGIIKQFPEAVQEQYRWIYSDSLNTVWYVMTGVSLLGLAVSFLVRGDLIKGGLSGSQNFQDRKKKVNPIEESC